MSGKVGCQNKDTFTSLLEMWNTHRYIHMSHTQTYIYISMYPDVVFGYLMARILHQFNQLLHDRDVLSEIPEDHGPCLFGQPTSESHDHMTFAGPVWMDDVALCLWGATNDAVASKLGVACGTRLDLFREHAMSPNLSKGKTELMFFTKGPKTNAWKKRLYGPLSTGFFPILGGPKPIRCPLSPAMRTWEAPYITQAPRDLRLEDALQLRTPVSINIESWSFRINSGTCRNGQSCSTAWSSANCAMQRRPGF